MDAVDRAVGCLVGQVAGDNLGALVEFQSRNEIISDWPSGPDLLMDGGVWGILAGQPTDDSEMAIALARSILAVGGYSQLAVVEAYCAWMKSGPFDCGNTVGAPLRRALASPPQMRLQVCLGQAELGSGSEANGALMRAAPIGILFAGAPESTFAAAELDAVLTHANPICVLTSAAFCAAIAEGIRTGERKAAVDAARKVVSGDHSNVPKKTTGIVDKLLEETLRERPSEYYHQMGWVRIAFQNAFYWLSTDATLEEAVVETVRSGGDTDTNAAIVGALLGATDGIAAIPYQWRDAVKSCRPARSSDTRHPRPATYWPDDIEAVAERVFRLSPLGSERSGVPPVSS